MVSQQMASVLFDEDSVYAVLVGVEEILSLVGLSASEFKRIDVYRVLIHLEITRWNI